MYGEPFMNEFMRSFYNVCISDTIQRNVVIYEFPWYCTHFIYGENLHKPYINGKSDKHVDLYERKKITMENKINKN